MGNPFDEYGVSDAEFEKEMNSQKVQDAKIELAEKVAAYWRSIAPVGTPAEGDMHLGRYRDSIEVTVRGKKVSVGTDDPNAGYIEYGTGEPGPTPEFACRARVQAHFGLISDE